MISIVLLIIITIFFPPVGVYLVSGCGADLLINICLTLLGVIPGHVHAFYLIWVLEKKKEQAQQGIVDNRAAAGVYSQNVQTGGQTYGTIAPTH
ncbi:hypothetical protein LTR08_007329 [Meristemomyces frigidus]|nr:hypothetical protein LTR08_007329 [Meristemomyces frigidus]